MSVLVKLRRTQHEHMSSGLPLKADIARCSRHVSNVPLGDMHAWFEMERSCKLRRITLNLQTYWRLANPCS
jgi:hypothetical protein